MNDLFEQLQSDLAKRIDEYYNRPRPEPVQIMPGGSLQSAAERAATAAFRRLKNSRWYALDESGRMEFGAFAVACQRVRAHNFVELLGTLAQVLPGWLQDRPSEQEPLIWPVDKISGQKIANPWVGELNTDRARSRTVIEETAPRLARHMKRLAELGGAPSAAMLDELDAE